MVCLSLLFLQQFGVVVYVADDFNFIIVHLFKVTVKFVPHHYKFAVDISYFAKRIIFIFDNIALKYLFAVLIGQACVLTDRLVVNINI
nr:MAG TPA: hypothetical protein [Caudoviricetes sp.]